jgi:hypothetical protein
MITKLVQKIVEASGKPRSTIYKSVVILVGACLILIIVPLLLLLASYGIEEYLLTHRLRILQVIFGFLCLGVCRIQKRNHPQIPTGFFIKLPQWTDSYLLIVEQAQIRT